MTRSAGRAARAVAAVVACASLIALPARARTICEPDAHPGGEWRRMGYDFGHSRHQPAEKKIGVPEAPFLEPFWTLSANEVTGTLFNEITGYPIVADGCLFVGTSRGFNRRGWIIAMNADGGDVAWTTQLPAGGVYSTLAVEDGVVYAFVSSVGSPYVAAIDEGSGRILWRTTVDTQQGSDAVSSPIVFAGMVWVGVSGTAAEGDDATRFDFRGSSVLLDASPLCSASAATDCTDPTPGATGGSILKRTYSIPDEAWDGGEGDSGGAIWSTIAIDPGSKTGFVGTGNPFNYENEHPNTNAILKLDLDRASPKFGGILGSYKGDVEEYFPQLGENVSCDENDPIGVFLAGFECARLDVDFGAAPQIFRARDGRLLVGEGQKSGVYHVVEAEDLDPVWKQVVGVPSLVGGIVGTPAYDGTSIYTPHTLVGYLTALDPNSGSHRWVSPTADGVHWGNPVTSANGVIYTVDLKGFLDAYHAGTGAPLLHRPLWLGAHTEGDPTFTWGGATVARNTVYSTVGVGITSAGSDFPSMPDGFVIAFRPSLDIVE